MARKVVYTDGQLARLQQRPTYYARATNTAAASNASTDWVPEALAGTSITGVYVPDYMNPAPDQTDNIDDNPFGDSSGEPLPNYETEYWGWRSDFITAHSGKSSRSGSGTSNRATLVGRLNPMTGLRRTPTPTLTRVPTNTRTRDTPTPRRLPGDGSIINGAPPTAETTPEEDDIMNGFSCPTPGQNDCLERIPRDDVTVLATVQDGSNSTVIDLENARGMHLCNISALMAMNIDTSDFNPTPGEIQQIYQAIFFSGTWSLYFRGKPVPGFSQRPLADIASEPGCCDVKKVNVNCVVPMIGGMEFRIDDLPTLDDAITVNFAVRAYFSGCGCPGNGGACGCGCGGGGKNNRRIGASSAYDFRRGNRFPPIDG